MRRINLVKDFLTKKIRKMDSAELATFIISCCSDYTDLVCSANDFPCREGKVDNCSDCVKLWLEKEN